MTLHAACRVLLSPLARRARMVSIVSPIIAVLAFLMAAPARAADTAVISGTVSNAATGNHLEGARVHIPQLGRTAFADETGRFVLSGLPAGSHELVISYIGLDTVRAEVRVQG